MSAQPSAAAPAKQPVKSKLLIVVGIVVLLAVVAVAAVLFLNNRNSGEEDAAAPAKAVAPTFLPLDNMVVNLADPGGDRFAQVGITLELQDEDTVKKIKEYMPSIRSGILLLVSQRTADELLTLEGKEKLATDIRAEASRPLTPAKAAPKRDQAEEDGYEEEARPARRAPNLVRRVLFSSFIIQ